MYLELTPYIENIAENVNSEFGKYRQLFESIPKSYGLDEVLANIPDLKLSTNQFQLIHDLHQALSLYNSGAHEQHLIEDLNEIVRSYLYLDSNNFSDDYFFTQACIILIYRVLREHDNCDLDEIIIRESHLLYLQQLSSNLAKSYASISLPIDEPESFTHHY
ncbi:hypothetical protein PSAR109036_06030 [Psychrobacter arenosus]|uniref:hypothetical protein n=1 Tax=Psychrobacter arenosus TaxID=256326 RepID=UPI001917FF9C|nr:hypothetical protein [Psychrobacter arenosus]